MVARRNFLSLLEMIGRLILLLEHEKIWSKVSSVIEHLGHLLLGYRVGYLVLSLDLVGSCSKRSFILKADRELKVLRSFFLRYLLRSTNIWAALKSGGLGSQDLLFHDSKVERCLKINLGQREMLQISVSLIKGEVESDL
jgi:hypothetical protein